MGTEAIYPVQTVLTRKDPKNDREDKLVVTGAGSKIIVESLVEFGGPFELDIRVARSEYDHEFPDGARLQQPAFHDFGPSPEQVFEAQERKDRAEGVVSTKSARKTGVRKTAQTLKQEQDAPRVEAPKPDLEEQKDLS